MVVLFAPALILLSFHILKDAFGVGTISGPVFIYLPSIIFCALIFWKKPCNLYVLPAGFLISLLFDPIWMSLLGKRYYFLFSSGNSAMIVSLITMGVIYALPFAILTIIVAAIMNLDKE